MVGEPELDSLQSEALFFLFGLLSLTPIIPSPLLPTVFHLKYSIFESCFYFLKCLRCVPLFGLVHGSRRSWLQCEIAPQYLASMLLSHSSSILFRHSRSFANIYWDKWGLTGVVKREKHQISQIFSQYHLFILNFIFIYFFFIHFFFLQLNL